MSTATGPRTIHVGDVIGSGSGAIFVVANSQLLGAAPRVAVGALAIAAVVLVVLVFVRDRRGPGAPTALPTSRRAYLITVAVEVVALVAGGTVLGRVAPQLAVAWVALVVGLHFVAFAIWWLPGSRVFLAVGAAMTGLAVVGIVVGVVGGLGAGDVVALIAGFGSGIVLLGASAPAVLARVRA